MLSENKVKKGGKGGKYSYLSDEPVREEVDRSDGPVLAPGQDNIVGHRQQTVHRVRVTGVLVTEKSKIIK